MRASTSSAIGLLTAPGLCAFAAVSWREKERRAAGIALAPDAGRWIVPGLGEIGRMGLLMTPNLGPLVWQEHC